LVQRAEEIPWKLRLSFANFELSFKQDINLLDELSFLNQYFLWHIALELDMAEEQVRNCFVNLAVHLEDLAIFNEFVISENYDVDFDLVWKLR